MDCLAQYVRLGVATVASTVAVVFSAFYSILSMPVIQVHYKLNVNQLPFLTRVLLDYRWFAFVVPILLFLSGIFILRRSSSKTFLELVLGCHWLFTVFYFAYTLIVWMLPTVPITDYPQ